MCKTSLSFETAGLAWDSRVAWLLSRHFKTTPFLCLPGGRAHAPPLILSVSGPAVPQPPARAGVRAPSVSAGCLCPVYPSALAGPDSFIFSSCTWPHRPSCHSPSQSSGCFHRCWNPTRTKYHLFQEALPVAPSKLTSLFLWAHVIMTLITPCSVLHIVSPRLFLLLNCDFLKIAHGSLHVCIALFLAWVLAPRGCSQLFVG